MKIRSILQSTLAILIFSLVFVLIPLKYSLPNGGFTGYAIILHHYIGLPVGLILIVLNILLFFVILLTTGSIQSLKSIYGYLCLGLSIDFFQKVLHVSPVQLDSFGAEIVLESIFAIIAGFTIALIIKSRYSSGGYTSIIMIVKRYFKISTPMIPLVMDILLIIVSFIISGKEAAMLLLINSLVFFFAFKFFLNLSYKKLFNNFVSFFGFKMPEYI